MYPILNISHVAMPSTAIKSEETAYLHSFSHGFISALSITLVSELGDKTFFIAAIMAMRHSRVIVFLGAMLALTIMTILSAGMGVLATNIPRNIVVNISAILFFVFGLKMLYEGYYMSSNEGQEEYNEVQDEILRKEQLLSDNYNHNIESIEEGKVSVPQQTYNIIKIFFARIELYLFRHFKNDNMLALIYTIGLQAFTLTFLAEWGDRSQITTIILSAKENVRGVSLGAIVGHSFCTLLAVIAGRYISTKLSIRLVTIVGACVFIIFGFTTLIFDAPKKSSEVLSFI